MQQLIDRLLLLAKIEQPTFKLNQQLTPLLPLMQSLAKDNTAKLQQQHLAPIHIYVDDKVVSESSPLNANISAHINVFADQFWLVQVLQNVLDNAIHFADSTINIYIHRSAESVKIDIFNDGQLLPDYAVTKAFDRYFSLSHHGHVHHDHSHNSHPHNSHATYGVGQNANEADSSTASAPTPKKGTGLGLTLVKQVIEHHGGQVAINNIHTHSEGEFAGIKQRSGVMVSITLPLAKE